MAHVTLGQHLLHARRRLFVGRTEECRAFEKALSTVEPLFTLLHIHGPGGVGKSTLLAAFARQCEDAGRPYAHVDGQHTEPSPEGWLSALRLALRLEAWEDSLATWLERPGRQVLLVDTYERLRPLDNWLREVFLPQLSDDTLIVLAGRDALPAAWRLDPGWADLLRTLPLRNLRPDESLDFLARRGVPRDDQAAVVRYTHGHPLALALAADLHRQAREGGDPPPSLGLGDNLDAVRALLERFVEDVPSPAHRAGLELCALVRWADEAILTDVLGPAATEVFTWLRGLSFMQTGPAGLAPHELARDALCAELRWRNRDWYAELHRRARRFYTDKVVRTTGAEQLQVLLDDVYLHRENPMVRPFLEWQEIGAVLAEAARPDDAQHFLNLVRKHEGAVSAELAAFWMTRPAAFLTAYRDAREVPAGFLLMLRLDQVSPQDEARDPAVQAALAALRTRAPLRPDEQALHFRFWLTRDTYQAVSGVQSVIWVSAAQQYFVHPRLAWSFFPCADPEFWRPALHYMDILHLPDADYEVQGRRFAVFAHDWRVTPVPAWLELLGEREIATNLTLASPPPPPPTLLVLSQPEFEAAARRALKTFAVPQRLHDSPLLRSRLVREWKGDSASPDVLRETLRAACEALRGHPRDDKLYRALRRTYLEPAPTQEIAAELLELPFSTYRRHLTAGLTRVVETLWHWELHGRTT